MQLNGIRAFFKKAVSLFPKITLVLISFFIVACSKKEGTSEQDCNMVACTEVFITITVSVKDASGVAIPLDNYEVIVNDSGKNLVEDFNNDEYQYYKEQGLYPILSDAHRIQLQNSTATITFNGFISENEVVSEEYVVGADCCHVRLISGNTEIILV